MIKAIVFDCFGVLYVPQGLATNVVRNDALLEYIQLLRSEYKIGVLSNMSPHGMDTYFSADEQRTLFDEVVVSGAVGMTKPSIEIFIHICDKLGVKPNQAIMIDDIEDNCAGARAAGMQAIRYESFAQMHDALREIFEISS